MSRLGQRPFIVSAGDWSLTAFELRDASSLLDLIRDPDVDMFTPLRSDPDIHYAEELIDRFANRWSDGTSAEFAVRDGDGELAGYVGLVALKLDARESQLRYMVRARHRRKGVATSVVQALTEWAFDCLDLIRIELRIDGRNAASMHVAKRCGYAFEGTLRNVYAKDGRRADLTIWARVRE